MTLRILTIPVPGLAMTLKKGRGSGYLIIIQDDEQDRPQQRGINALSEDWRTHRV